MVDGTLLSRAAYDALASELIAEITAHHKREPLARGLPKESLREKFFAGASPEFFRGVLAALEQDGAFISEKEMVRLRDHARDLSPDDVTLRDALEHLYRAAGVAPPALADALTQTAGNSNAQHGRKILQLLLDSGALVRVHGEMLFHREALKELVTKLRAHATNQPDRTIDVGMFKDLAGVSRKYAIPLLEHFDRQRVTRREGDRRVVL